MDVFRLVSLFGVAILIFEKRIRLSLTNCNFLELFASFKGSRSSDPKAGSDFLDIIGVLDKNFEPMVLDLVVQEPLLL